VQALLSRGLVAECQAAFARQVCPEYRLGHTGHMPPGWGEMGISSRR
jgi:hypothetical protein